MHAVTLHGSICSYREGLFLESGREKGISRGIHHSLTQKSGHRESYCEQFSKRPHFLTMNESAARLLTIRRLGTVNGYREPC